MYIYIYITMKHLFVILNLKDYDGCLGISTDFPMFCPSLVRRAANPRQAATEPAFTGKTTNGYVPWHGSRKLEGIFSGKSRGFQRVMGLPNSWVVFDKGQSHRSTWMMTGDIWG